MLNVARTDSFLFPGTKVPVRFVFDSVTETLWIEVCRSVSCPRTPEEDVAFQQAAELCEAWGQKACASQLAANRIIQKEFPQAVSAGAVFLG